MSQYATSHDGSTIGVRRPTPAHRGTKPIMGVFEYFAKWTRQQSAKSGLPRCYLKKPRDYMGLDILLRAGEGE